MKADRFDRAAKTLAFSTNRRRLLVGAVAGALFAPDRRSATAQCELVELYPGYPGYRGYITGLDGVGDHACLANLEAVDPSFDRTLEDAQNLAAASRIGLAGGPEDWTWENWMAIEAERGLSPTCYSCALLGGPNRPNPLSGPFPADDPRLLIGDYATTGVAGRLLVERGAAPGALSTVLPFDADLRSLVGMEYPHQHLNAGQMLAGYGGLVNAFAMQGYYPNTALLLQNLIAQGGYRPTSPTALPNDQIMVISVGVQTLSRFLNPAAGQGLLQQLNTSITTWRGALARSPGAPSFAEWLRVNGFLSF